MRERGLQVLSSLVCPIWKAIDFVHYLLVNNAVFSSLGYYGKSDLLILDEPCSGLDLPAREQFLRTVENMAREEHKPFIYVLIKLKRLCQVLHM